ncbi:MAG: DUF1493 family protein [Rheinheimera sp.]|nr:DUF1493 family protein [Rheinheimera sp.]
MNLQYEVISFVAGYFGVDASKISLDTTINYDLGVDGEDGVDFLLAFSKAFNVDLQSLEKIYFGSEGFGLSIFVWPLLALLNTFRFKQTWFIKTSPLPVRVLVASALERRWVHD